MAKKTGSTFDGLSLEYLWDIQGKDPQESWKYASGVKERSLG